VLHKLILSAFISTDDLYWGAMTVHDQSMQSQAAENYTFSCSTSFSCYRITFPSLMD